MGKCVSRQSTCPSNAAHHQSVLTIALSQQDLVHAHKIWQQLTSSNEYIAATTTTATTTADEPTFYYHISHNQAESALETQAAAETEEEEEEEEKENEAGEAEEELELQAATVLHIESVYNHLEAHVNRNGNAVNVIDNYATCQDFLLQELLAQTLAECQGKNITSAQSQPIQPEKEEDEQQQPQPEEVWQLRDSFINSDSNKELEPQFQEPCKGQTESKKHGSKASRRNNGNELQQLEPGETKGTAMSFGFRKKLNGTPKKFKKLLEGGGGGNSSTAPDSRGTGEADRAQTTDTKDDNGNATATAAPIKFEKVGVAAQKTNASNRTGAAGKRFGYRGAVPRPASTGLTHSREDSEEAAANAQNNNSNSNAGNNNNNNAGNNVLVSNLKRRSKSAHAGRTIDGEPKIAQPKTLTFNLNQNTTIEYQRRQFFGEIPDDGMNASSAAAAATSRQQRYNYNNLANMHANVIVRPTPRPTPASYAKFTLQTVSLPRPEYPVAISLTATTPTTPSSSVQSPVPSHGTGARAKDIATSSRQHPLTSIHVAPPSNHGRQLDQKSVKQLTNNSTRRGFSGSREISADSGIASMDNALDSGSSSGGSGGGSSKRSRSRPRNLQMVMSGRHTFEVRDMDDPPSSESNSFVETLALPKLPTDNSQTTPLPLVGLVRSNTVLSRESYERRQTSVVAGQDQAGVSMQTPESPPKPKASGSDDSESVDEEKLYLDSSTSEKSAKQQSQSPSSSMSWRCEAGESLAARDCSSMSITSSDTQAPTQGNNKEEEDMSLCLDDISLIHTDMDIPFSTISSMTEPTPKPNCSAGQEHLLNMHLVDNREVVDMRLPSERPRSFNNALNESKFAELALASSHCLLLEDETSPTDSLVSSTEESEEAGGKLKKHKLNAELQQKDYDVDIDDISPVLELELDPGSHSRSPLSPGTPTHASHSLSLGSDCGNLIDDEIADQPALLCNSEAQEMATDTPTLMETHTHTQTGSLRSLKSQSKARTALQQAIELSLRTPAAVRRAVLESAESLDTLSPCESICSDDLMMDFDLNSSVDSIDRTASMRSRSGSDLHKLGTELDADQAETEAELLAQLECKGSDVMKELNSLLRVRMQRSAPSPRERISAKLPARATRLLNRSRLQDQQQQQLHQQLTGHDSDNSLRSTHSGASSRKRSTAASRASTASSTSSLQRRQQHQQQQQFCSATATGSRRAPGQGGNGNTELHSSSDDLMLYDKSFRNAMIQDVLQFKKQLLRLRRILQETETLNPFENDNVQLFAACGLDSKQLNDIDLASLTSSTTEDPLQELSDLRRQVVYLQGQVDDRDRTIRLQRDLIEQLEAEKRQVSSGDPTASQANKELISMATQTERTRPLAIGAEGLSRSKPEYTSYTTHFPTLHLHCNDSTVAATTIIRHQQQQQQPCNGHHHSNHHSNHSSNHSSSNSNSNSNSSSNSNINSNCRALSQTRRHTIISTTLTNYNQQLAAAAYPRRASIGWDAAESAATTPTTVAAAHKPVRITLIGEALPLQNGTCHKKLPPQHQQQQQSAQQQQQQTRFLNGCQSSAGPPGTPYQPLYNSNKMTNPTVTIV